MSFHHASIFSEGSTSPRTELLHNIDPLYDPGGNRHPDSKFDNRIRAALRMGDYKIVTGNPGILVTNTCCVMLHKHTQNI